MADWARPTTPLDAGPVVEQIDSLLRRDVEIDDAADDSVGLQLVDGAASPEPALSFGEQAAASSAHSRLAELSEPTMVDALGRLVAPLGNPQLDRLMGLVRRQTSTVS